MNDIQLNSDKLYVVRIYHEIKYQFEKKYDILKQSGKIGRKNKNNDGDFERITFEVVFGK